MNHEPMTKESIGAETKSLAGFMGWFLVGALWVAYFINYTDRQSVFSMFPVLKRDLGFSDTQLGLIGSIFIWVYSICGAFAGRIADQFRRDWIVVLSAVLWSLTIVGTAFSTSVIIFLFWRGLIAVTESLYVPAALGLIATWHNGGTRTRAISIHCTAPPFGLAFGGWFGGWSAETIGWRVGFSILGVIGIAYALLLFVLFRRFPTRSRRVTARPATPWDILRSRCYLAETFAYFMFQLVLWVIYAWLPNFIYERYHLSMAESGLTATLYLQSSTVVGVLAGGALGDWAHKRLRFSRFLICGSGLLVSCPFAYLLLATHSLSMLKIFAAIFGLSVGLLISNSWAAAFDVVDERNYSFAAAFLNLTSGFAAGTGIFLVGLWKESAVSFMGWCTLVTAASAILLMAVAVKYFDQDRNRLLSVSDTA